jgi:IclR family acetate operon transcriptional repressor
VTSGDKPTAGPSTLQTVERALSFLELVSASPTPLTIKDVSTRLQVNLTTCYHLFNTLNVRGYVERNPDLTLRIGFQAAVLNDGYRRGFSTQEQMNQFVHDLAETTAETAWLSTLVNNSVVLTAFQDGPQAVRATGLYVGLSGLEHVRSAGRAVLAYLDDSGRNDILARSLSGLAPSQQPAIRAALDIDLEGIRRRGWALDDEDFNVGIVGIAAPFFAADRRVLGAVGIWAPAARAHERLHDLADKVVAGGQEASAVFGQVQ